MEKYKGMYGAFTEAGRGMEWREGMRKRQKISKPDCSTY